MFLMIVIQRAQSNEGGYEEDDVENEASGGCDEEDGDWADKDDDGGNSNGEEQLKGEDRVNLANECPPELRTLQHRWVQLPISRFHIVFPLLPHLLIDTIQNGFR